MGTNLNRKSYEDLIKENIEALEKYMPQHSLEKKHTIDVLNWSVKQLYDLPSHICEKCYRAKYDVTDLCHCSEHK